METNEIDNTTNENIKPTIDETSIENVTDEIKKVEITNDVNENKIMEDKIQENTIENKESNNIEKNAEPIKNTEETKNKEDIEASSSNKGKMEEIDETLNENKINDNNEKLSTPENELKKEENTEKKSKINDKEENIYKLKVIEKRNEYQGIIQQKNIITQNINGPCPLLALCNILILRGDISIPLKKTEITYEEIIDILGDYIARNTGNNDNSDECGFQDVLDIIPTLKKGLDINVKFDSVQSFEPSPALTVFKFFNIKLVHGWTVDPEDKEAYKILVKECGNYNSVVEMIIESDSANASKEKLNEESIEDKNKRENLYHKAMVCKNFIESTASQLTYHGLTSIPEVLSVGEPTAFFRNNHFLTLIKTPDNKMYTLVTDQGFVNEKKIVWESLSTLDGDSYFFDGLFNKYDERSNNNDLILNSPNEDLDYAIALSLQEDEEKKRNEMRERNSNRKNSSSTNNHRTKNKNKNYRYSTPGGNPPPAHRRPSSNNNSNHNRTKYANQSNPKDNDDDKCVVM